MKHHDGIGSRDARGLHDEIGRQAGNRELNALFGSLRAAPATNGREHSPESLDPESLGQFPWRHLSLVRISVGHDEAVHRADTPLRVLTRIEFLPDGVVRRGPY